MGCINKFYASALSVKINQNNQKFDDGKKSDDKRKIVKITNKLDN